MTADPGSAEGDLYAALGVPRTASAEEVRVAYRALAQRYHPDHNPLDLDAERRMQAINRAFAVLNVPATRDEYDRRLMVRPATTAEPDAKHGAGRGQRPYYRGKNWGLHTGADAPPEFIVRAVPSSFNLVVDAIHDCPSRAVSVHNDAPFSVRMAAVPSPWLMVSAQEVELEANGQTTLWIGASAEAAAQQRGWRDGGVSLLTDDPRVFCPDVRVTAIFLGTDVPAPARRNAGVPQPGEPDLRERSDQDSPATSSRRGWRRLFGR